MPTTARASRTDGDAEAGAAEAEKCKKVRVTLPVLSVLQTVLQHAAEALADKTKELTDVLGSINNDQLVAEPDVWLQHRPQRTTRRTADGSRTAQIASHGRLTACRSRLMRYPDRADDQRASLFLRRGALCILACVVHVHDVGFRTAVCVIRRPLFILGSHTTQYDTRYREQARECVLELELWSCVAKWLTGRNSSRSRISMHISKNRETAHSWRPIDRV